MKKYKSSQFKAAFLIIVFSLNSIIGFACAAGLDMGFNARHHHDDDVIETTHFHANSKKHIHPEAPEKDHRKTTDDNDNCCHDKVIKIAQLDKAVPQIFNIVVPISLNSLISFYNIDVLFFSHVSPNIKYFVRSHHPPIPDIRIAIQSFQI